MSDPTADLGVFAGRHIGPRLEDMPDMLRAVGVSSLDELIDRAVPEVIRNDQPHHLPGPLTETEALDRLADYAAENEVYTSMIGMGYHATILPAVIRRSLLENPGWYTAYTPYQPEISQGRLEALLNFQTMVADLTGMDIANASLLDEGTAAAEAMAMLKRVNKPDDGGEAGTVFLVAADTHPQTVAVIKTRAEPLGIEVVVADPAHGIPDGCFGVLLSYPGTTGALQDHTAFIAAAHDEGALVAVAADPLALTLVKPPGEMGADVVVGSSQRFGVPMMYGGPHAGYMATREKYQRQLPGRVVGVSRDAEGRMGLRLTLQTREQHIRREKATSNICTAQVLLANIAGMYGVYHGPEGLTRIAVTVHELASTLAAALGEGGLKLRNDTWFDTIAVDLADADAVIAAAAERRINLRRIDDTTVGIALDETTTQDDLGVLCEVFEVQPVSGDAPSGIPQALVRGSEFMTHPVFHRYRSETELMRYLRRLQDADIALDRAMIPLGSCTMKLNAAAELIPITWPGFSDIHPYAPADQAKGYARLIDDLEAWLADITGYDAVSLQPNSGAQGEFSGLLAIKAYQESIGEGHRDVCLIPASAHGTNPASATMAGLRVVVVKTDEEGNIDVEDLRARAAEHAGSLAAIMVTYPSTHGVFEEAIVEVCDIVHESGGQVYLDGANLNAMVGIAEPGLFGSDVSHLNLHKTFAIPHGGGGPGVGPIAVREHLAPFLPGNPLGGDSPVGAVASANWGSAGILPISWAYIAMMGEAGLRFATDVAILNANYIAARLAPHYPVLYTGEHGLVAHECILDIRGIQAETGVTNEDVAKRLVDYGFHAPTMSFPVAGTLMIEPTESEPKYELDRFCEAMIAIKGEIDAIAAGDVSHADSMLAHAPHPAENLLADDWDRPYTREEAAYPVEGLRRDKYWVPVSRIDNAYGDRHIVCSCPPIEAYMEGISAGE
jgi:glycine cleavage system P protein (glycine dehydrogenase)